MLWVLGHRHETTRSTKTVLVRLRRFKLRWQIMWPKCKLFPATNSSTSWNSAAFQHSCVLQQINYKLLWLVGVVLHQNMHRRCDLALIFDTRKNGLIFIIGKPRSFQCALTTDFGFAGFFFLMEFKCEAAASLCRKSLALISLIDELCTQFLLDDFLE